MSRNLKKTYLLKSAQSDQGSSLSAWRHFASLFIPNLPRKESDQAAHILCPYVRRYVFLLRGLSLCWAHVSEGLFSHVTAQMVYLNVCAFWYTSANSVSMRGGGGGGGGKDILFCYCCCCCFFCFFFFVFFFCFVVFFFCCCFFWFLSAGYLGIY